MRKLIFLLAFALIAMAFSDTNRASKNKYSKHDLFYDDGVGTPDTIYLDSAEVDTMVDIWHIGNLERFALEDLWGTFTFTCKDSAGTDSVDVTMEVEGGFEADHTGNWTSLKTLTATSNDGSVNRATDTLATPYGYPYFRIVLTNTATGNAADEKPACYDGYWVYRPDGRADD